MRKSTVNIVIGLVVLIIFIIFLLSLLKYYKTTSEESKKDINKLLKEFNKKNTLVDQVYFGKLFGVTKLFHYDYGQLSDVNFLLLSFYRSTFYSFISQSDSINYLYPFNTLFLMDTSDKYQLLFPTGFKDGLKSLDNLIYLDTTYIDKPMKININVPSKNFQYFFTLYNPFTQQSEGVKRFQGYYIIKDRNFKLEPLVFVSGMKNVSKVNFQLSKSSFVECDINNDECKFISNGKVLDSVNIHLNDYIAILIDRGRMLIFNDTTIKKMRVGIPVFFNVIFEGNNAIVFYPTSYIDRSVQILCFYLNDTRYCFPNKFSTSDVKKYIDTTFQPIEMKNLTLIMYSVDSALLPVGVIGNDKYFFGKDNNIEVNEAYVDFIKRNNVYILSSRNFLNKLLES